MANRVVHFEIHAEDPERAAAFYKAVFGWEITKWLNPPGSPDRSGDVGDSPAMEYWMIMTAPKDSTEPGINGGLMRRRGTAPVEGQAVNAFVSTMDVASYDETHEKILKAGGTMAVPKAALPGMAWLGYYKDTEGNIFGIYQTDPNAK